MFKKNLNASKPSEHPPQVEECLIQWRLRFKIAVCHTEENYLKHVTLLNRFKIVFLLNRDIGLRETYLKPNIWVLESPGLGSRALKGQAVAVAPN